MSRIKLNRQLFAAFTILMVFCAAGVTDAQEISEQWNLNKCISYALEKNLTVNQSKLRIISSDADVVQARGQRLPNLSGSASQSITNRSASTGNESSDLSYTSSLSVASAVTIYNGGIISNDIQRSERSRELAMLNLEQAQNNITLSVTQAYLNALYAKENLEYYVQVVEASERQVVRAKALQNAGSIARRDVADIEAQYANDRYAKVNAANNLVQQVTNLKQILEIPVEEPFELYFPKDGVKEVLEPLPLRETAFASALNFRPEVKGSQLQQEMAQLDLKSARAAYLPSLGLSGSLSTDYNNQLALGFGTQLSDNFMQRVGLNLSIPIFSRYATRASVSRSQVNLDIAGLTVANTRNKLLQEVEKVYEDTWAAQQRFEAALAQEQATAESYRLAQEQYNIGMLNAFELLQIKNNYLNANRELIQSRYTTVLYRKILDFYMGVPIELEY